MSHSIERFVPELVIRTKYGEIKGKHHSKNQTVCWLGVPYAMPPTGELRWKAPREPKEWDGVLDTIEYRSASVQIVNGENIGNEDCLYLNIWKPNQPREWLPVFVFAHGGGNISGSGKDFVGDHLAHSLNAIVITMNYRLGAMGFFRHPVLNNDDAVDDSGNYGLLDLLQSLQWVKENITLFGGDPERVTLAGQSAGARNVLAAMISPYGNGRFQQVIALSGGMTTSDPKEGERKVHEFMISQLIKDGIATSEEEADLYFTNQTPENIAIYLRNLKPEVFAAYFTDPAIRMEPFPHLFRDGAVIPNEGFQCFVNGNYNKVPLVLGSTETEFSGYAATETYFSERLANGTLFNDDIESKRFQATVRYGSELYAGFNVERTAELITNHKDQPPIYGYRFAWGTREGVVSEDIRTMLGAPHGADLDFYTGYATGLSQILGTGYYNNENRTGRERLSNALVKYISKFLYTGDPNDGNLPQWLPWSRNAKIGHLLRLDSELNNVVIGMVEGFATKEEIVGRMKAELQSEDYELLQQLFKGRFFW